MYRYVMIFSLLLAAMGVTQASEPSVPAPSPTKASAAGFANYDRIRQSLSHDSMKDIQQVAAALESELGAVTGAGKADALEAAKAAHQLASEASIAGARTVFKALSGSYIRFLSQARATGELSRFHCPMAKADWVQSDRQTANPYFGASMLACGEIVPWDKEK